MTVLNPNETTKNWRTDAREPSLLLYVSGAEGDAGALAGTRISGVPLTLCLSPVTDWIDSEEVAGAVAAVVQVDPDTPASIKRFEKLASSVETPLIAAAYDPPLALVRSLIRAGAHDVVPLPLSIDDLEASIATLVQRKHDLQTHRAVQTGKLVSVIKSVGGVGATALLTQMSILYASSEAQYGRETCLIDLDVQFGDIAFQLGLNPRLSLADLLEASGSRLDGSLIRATVTDHRSGLKVIAAPSEMMPLESVSSEHLLQIVDQAKKEFGTTFVELPTNWTNWSLSLVARSDLVLLITELSVAGLNRAKRQLDLLESQGLGALDIRVIVNRYEKAQSRTIRPADVKAALGRDIAYTVSNDFALVRSAIDRGVPLTEVKRKNAISKDLQLLDSGIAAGLGLER
jgi:pilus assembly protein CpaE